MYYENRCIIHFIIKLSSGHIGYDSLVCGGAYLKCPAQDGEITQCIDNDLPSLSGKDYKITGWFH